MGKHIWNLGIPVNVTAVKELVYVFWSCGFKAGIFRIKPPF